MSDPQCSQTDRGGIDFLLAQVGAHAAARFAERLEPLKLVPAQVGILRIIERQSGLSQQALADLLGMFPSRLVLVLDVMEGAGLIGGDSIRADLGSYQLILWRRGRR